VYEVRYDSEINEISYHKICEYQIKLDSWLFNYSIGDKVRELGSFENPQALEIYVNTLKTLAKKYPLPPKVLKPVYSNIKSDAS